MSLLLLVRHLLLEAMHLFLVEKEWHEAFKKVFWVLHRVSLWTPATPLCADRHLCLFAERHRGCRQKPNESSSFSSVLAKTFQQIAMASNLLATASYLIGMASNLIAMASNLLAMASNLLATASNLIAMACNPIAMASNML